MNLDSKYCFSSEPPVVGCHGVTRPATLYLIRLHPDTHRLPQPTDLSGVSLPSSGRQRVVLYDLLMSMNTGGLSITCEMTH